MTVDPTPTPDPAATPAAAGAPASSGPKKLYRSRTDRKIAGICAGIAEYFGWDPTLVRVLFVLSILLPGPQLLAYLILWVIIPERPAS